MSSSPTPADTNPYTVLNAMKALQPSIIINAHEHITGESDLSTYVVWDKSGDMWDVSMGWKVSEDEERR